MISSHRNMATANRKNHFKVVLLGEGCVGKTSLVLRYVQDKFNDKHLTTLQVRNIVAFSEKKVWDDLKVLGKAF